MNHLFVLAKHLSQLFICGLCRNSINGLDRAGQVIALLVLILIHTLQIFHQIIYLPEYSQADLREPIKVSVIGS